MNLFTLYATLGLNADNFEKGVDKASQQGKGLASSLTSSVGGASNFVTQKISAGTVAMGNLMADAAKGLASLGKTMVTTGINYNATMQTYQTNFTTLLNGSSEAAAELTSELEEMAAATPFAMSDLTGATQTLLSFGQSSETVMDTLQTLGDISMGDKDRLASLTLAFAQASSTGKLMGQNLMQMINAGFNPLNTIAEQTGASMSELKDFMSSGKASGDLKKLMRDARREVKNLGDDASDGAKMLVQMYEDGAISADLLAQVFKIETSPGGKFYQAMENASKTHAGMIATLEDDASALMGKVFKPLSNFIDEEILPASIDLIAKMSEGYDLNGLMGAVTAGTDFVGEKLGEWGGLALDAGASLLANLYTGLTGDETSPEEIKTYIGGVFNGAKDKISTVIDTGKSFFSGFLAGLNGDSASENNIILKLGGLFSNYHNAKSAFLVSGGTLLGKFYTRLTGNEATAENIGKTFGDLFEKGTTGVSSLLGSAETFFTDFLSGLDGDVTAESSIGTKLGGLFTAGSDAAASLIETGKGLLGKLYEGVTGQEATADNVKATLKGVFDAATTAAGDVITTGTTFFTDLKAALDSNYTGEDAAKLKISAVFQSTSDAMLGVIQDSENFLANVYEAITGDTETAEKIRKFFTFEGTGATQEEEVTHYQTSYQQIITDLANAGLLDSAAVDTFLDVAANEHLGSTKYKNMAALLAPMYQEYTSGAYEGNAEAERIARERVEKGLEWLNNGKMEELLAAWLPIRERRSGSEKEKNDAAYDWLTEVEDEFPYKKYWLSGGTGKSPYNPEWTTAWNYKDLDNGLDSAERMEQAAQALMEAAAVLSAALAGAEVTLDGEKVGELTSEYVKRDVVREMRTQFPNLWGR